jgi:uncharacterized protein
MGTHLAAETRLVVIQPSSFCNIDCRYCYVPERSNRAVIQDTVLEDILTKVFQSRRVPDGFTLVWHNGEPLALGRNFFQRALSIIRRVNPGKSFKHAIQTNATLIDDRWADFLAESNICPSVSIDGPRYVHDVNRVTRRGTGTLDDTLRGIQCLRRRGIPLVALAVVSLTSLPFGKEIFNFLFELGFESIGLIVEEPWGANSNSSLDTHNRQAIDEAFEQFIEDFFHAWFPNRHQVTVREFSEVGQSLISLKHKRQAVSRFQDSSPGTVLSFDRLGNITTFSPQMIAGTQDESSKFIVANISDVPDLEHIGVAQKHIELFEAIERGIDMCRHECGYFDLCGGGSPASKFYEHGRFDCTETRDCRFTKQKVTQLLLNQMRQLNEARGRLPV